MPVGEQSAEVAEPAPIDRQQQRVARRRGELGAEQRREPLGTRVLVEANREVEVVAIGERERAVPERQRAIDERLGRGDAVQQRAMRPHARSG